MIKDAVCFSNGKKCDAAAVKACLEHLIEVHERAAGNLKIASMEADGQKLTIVTSEPNPILMNYLSEAYGCIIDMEVGIPDNGCVVGTGPYVATEVVTDDHVNLIKNVNYWNGEVKVDEITVRTISDGDNGYGYTATGAFPDSFAFGQGIQTVSFDPDQARAELEAAGWVDTDGDGIREKNGVKLTIRWLTYPSRQELPLLAESAQSTLKDIGIDVQINCTKDHNSIRKDPTAWDIWVSANVNAGLGDPQNFFDTYCLDESVKNSGGHHSDKLEKLAVRLRTTFDPTERAKIAVEMQQQLLDDNSYVFCSFLRMSMIMKANVSGLEAHTCDFYELTADLDIQ